MPLFDKRFNNYFDEYGNCQLYSTHLKCLYDIISVQLSGAEGLHSFRVFLNNCLDNNIELYVIGD